MKEFYIIFSNRINNKKIYKMIFYPVHPLDPDSDGTNFNSLFSREEDLFFLVSICYHALTITQAMWRIPIMKYLFLHSELTKMIKTFFLVFLFRFFPL